MRRLGALLFSALALLPAGAADLTKIEQRWLQGAAPVLEFARQHKLPLDIIVQPNPLPGVAPLALAYIKGRCKLVLSMRGNPEAQATLERIEPELLDAALEMMAAHELGHCRRYVDGAWHGLPAGFSAPDASVVSPELRATYLGMRAARREEGYADLVGLAWIEQRRPREYARLYAWLRAERERDLLPGSHHDTLAWLDLSRSGVARGADSIFGAAQPMWTAGLAVED
ncbi:hypothetical protein HLB44_34645 [Aquincola sp. S2]|uniref:Uncharacterized protein n=2 Tax=Pseudaquabacterium terrae TaxID=2732868 RepID=A0ABX2EU05_9BURK|nr:hypothetical protein [Aquabacterium terrae]